MLGSKTCSVIVLVFIVFILTGFMRDFLTEVNSKNKGELLMKTKMKKVFVAIAKSILNSLWTVGANLLAGALLT